MGKTVSKFEKLRKGWSNHKCGNKGPDCKAVIWCHGSTLRRSSFLKGLSPPKMSHTTGGTCAPTCPPRVTGNDTWWLPVWHTHSPAPSLSEGETLEALGKQCSQAGAAHSSAPMGFWGAGPPKPVHLHGTLLESKPTGSMTLTRKELWALEAQTCGKKP